MNYQGLANIWRKESRSYSTPSKSQKGHVAALLLAEAETLPGENNFKITTTDVLIEEKKGKK